MKLPAGVTPVRIPELPKNEGERKALRRICDKAARRVTKGAGAWIRETLASQLYYDALEEAGRRVREAPQSSLIQKPEHQAAAALPIPANMQRSPSGLLVPTP